jgi:hypothetical protein
MDRVKLAISSLLPALWLVAAGQSLANPAGGQTGDNGTASIFRGERGGHGPLAATGSWTQSARHSHRRAGPQGGWGGFPFTADLPSAEPVRFEPVFLSSIGSTDALGLARCWQFHWRTALEPRAPSAVS